MSFTIPRAVNIEKMVIIFIISAALPCVICGSHNLNGARVAIWCSDRVKSTSQYTISAMAANISSRFNVSLVIEVLNLNFSSDDVYQVLDRAKQHKRQPGVFVITNIGLKNSLIWAKLLGNTESVIVNVLSPSQGEISKSQVGSDVKAYLNIMTYGKGSPSTHDYPIASHMNISNNHFLILRK